MNPPPGADPGAPDVPDETVPGFQPATWTLTMWRRPTSSDPVWEPCIAVWLPPGDLGALLAILGLSAPDSATEGVGDPFEGRMIEPVGIGVLYDAEDRPPTIRCMLPDPNAVDHDAATVDLPAAAALTAALANHNDDTWHFPIILATGDPLPAGDPLPVRNAAVVLMLDQDPLAESISGSLGLPEDLGASAAGPGVLQDAFGSLAVAVRGEAWAIVAGLTCGHAVSVQRLLMHAQLLATVAEELHGLPEAADQDRLTRLRGAGAQSPGAPTGLAMFTQVAMFHAAAIEALTAADIPDPVGVDLAAVLRRARAGQAGARTAASGVLDRISPDLWADLARAARPDPVGWMTAVAEAHTADLLLVLAAQTAVRAEALRPGEPVHALLSLVHGVYDVAPEVWPLIALASSLAAHDTVLLRALLGDEEQEVPYLRSLLHSVHEALTDGSAPVLAGAVRLALEEHTPAADPSGALAVLDALTDPDECGCGLLRERPYASLADGMCTLLPAVADATAFLVTDDVGSEDWVTARDAALFALLSTRTA